MRWKSVSASASAGSRSGRSISRISRASTGAPDAGFALVERLGEAVEIVNGVRFLRRGHAGAIRVPVGGNRQYRRGSGQAAAQCFPTAGVAVVLEGVHRAAVSHKQGGHAGLGHGGSPELPGRSQYRGKTVRRGNRAAAAARKVSRIARRLKNQASCASCSCAVSSAFRRDSSPVARPSAYTNATSSMPTKPRNWRMKLVCGWSSP